MTPRAERGKRADYVRYHSISTRWMDNDAYGHINNVVYYSFFDTAVNRLLIEAGLLDVARGPTIGLVVETQCRYFSPASFPSDIHAGVRVAHLGRSSVRYEIGLFRNDDELASAEGHFVHVFVDRDSGRPVPVPDDMRRFLELLRAPG